VPKARRRLLPNLLLKLTKLARNQLNPLKLLRKQLIKSPNTLHPNQLIEKKELLKRKDPQLPRDQSQRNKPQLCHHQVERNQRPQLI
jgi:hypothetical protein